MKNRSTRARLAILLALLPASTAVATDIWTTAATPTKVYTGYSNGEVYLQGMGNPAGCMKANIQFNPATADTTKILSLALAAYLSGRKLSCVVSGCSADQYQSGRQCDIE
jgi:hypothetical protein